MERNRREFHQEPNHQHHKQDFLQALTEEPRTTGVGRLSVGGESRDVEGSTGPSTRIGQVLWLKEVHRDQTQKHDDRGRKGVDEEFLRGVFSVVSTPF